MILDDPFRKTTIFSTLGPNKFELTMNYRPVHPLKRVELP